jgi:hypothetical protein
MLSYTQIIEKIKDIISQEHGNKKILDKDIAAALEIDYNRFRQQKHRDIFIPYSEIMQFLAKRNISINWFFFNQLPETLIDATSNFIILKYQKTITATAGGGGINYEINPAPIVIDKQLLDHINSSYKYTEILQVFGDSMEPDIKEGSLIFVDRSDTTIKQSAVYVINTLEGIVVKMIKIQDNKYCLCSSNKEYEDIEVNDFEVIGRVKGMFLIV